MLTGRGLVLALAAAAFLAGVPSLSARADDQVIAGAVSTASVASENQQAPVKTADEKGSQVQIAAAGPGYAKTGPAARPIRHAPKRAARHYWRRMSVSWNAPPVHVHTCPPHCGRLLMLGVAF